MASHRHDISYLGDEVSLYPIRTNQYAQLKPRWTRKHFRKIQKKISKKFDAWSYIIITKSSPAVQPYIYKQFKPHWTKKHLKHIIPKIAKKFDDWSTIVEIKRSPAIQPYLLKQFIPHWKHRKLTHHYFRNRKVSPQYDAWKTSTFIPVTIYGFNLQPYILKQFIPHWKARIKSHRFAKPFRTTPKYDAYRSSVLIPPILNSIAVNIIVGKPIHVTVTPPDKNILDVDVPK